MFSIRDFIIKTLEGMVKKYPDFQVREYALNWYGKGKLSEEDLAYLDSVLEPKVEEVVEEVIEEVVEEVIEETTEE